MTTVVSDNFNSLTQGTALNGRTPVPTTAGNNWTVTSGAAWQGATGGGKVTSNTGGSAWHTTVDGGASGITVGVDINFSTTDNAGVILFQNDASNATVNGYMAFIRPGSTVFQFSRLDNGARTDIATSSFTPSTGTVYTVTLKQSGSSFTAQINGGNTISQSDATYSNLTKGGMTYYFAAAGNNCTFDNFTINTNAAAAAVVLRRDLAPLGTRVGSRQMIIS